MIHETASILKLMTPAQRKKFAGTQLLLALSAGIQVAGIASIAPFIALLTNPGLIQSNDVAKYVYDLLRCESATEFLQITALLVMVSILISNAISAFSFWLIQVFSLALGEELQQSTFKSFMHKDYEVYSQKSSSEMTNILIQEVQRYVYMVIQPFLNLCSQIFVAVIIVGLLIYVDPLLAIMAAALISVGYAAIYYFFRKKLLHHGERISLSGEQKYRLLGESLTGIKEVKLLQLESLYEQRLASAYRMAIRSSIFLGLAGDIPRFVLESIAFCALLTLAIVMLATEGLSSQVVSILSLYAMAGYKLLPTAQTIYKSISQIKANIQAKDKFHAEVAEGRRVKDPEPSTAPAPTFEHGDIILENIVYRYPGTEQPAISNVTTTIERNAITSLIGLSGAGKSTLADIILGLLFPTSGQLKLGKTSIQRSTVHSWQKKLGYVPQNIFLFEGSVKSNIAFGVPDNEIDLDRVKHAARLASIDKFIESLPNQYDQPIGERGGMLSGGQKQRIGIARALYHDPEILVLDEPTSALDSFTERDIIKTLRALSKTKTIIMITHRIPTIIASDKIIMLDQGQISAAGNHQTLSETSESFKKLLQTADSGTLQE